MVRKATRRERFHQVCVVILSGLWIMTMQGISRSCSQDAAQDPFGAQPAAAQARKIIELKKQEDEPAPATQEEKKRDESKTQDPDGEIEIPRPEVPPNFIRLHLNNGDIASGKLSNDLLTISTEFGSLSVPIEKIVRFEPGLISYPQKVAELEALVNQLGSDVYSEREIAHKKLVMKGLKIKNEIEKYSDNDNAERKRHLTEIRRELEKMANEMGEEELENPDNQPWQKNDKLITETFTAVGKIQEEEFRLNGKFGALTIPLSEIAKGMRPRSGRPNVEKRLTLKEENFIQLKYKSAGFSVVKGDMVSVEASGGLNMTPWGSNVRTSPNGNPKYGFMPNTQGIPYGMLVAKIGNGKYFKIGEKKRFRAKSSGKLYFGITMRDSYVGKNYRFPGEYKVRVKLEPGRDE